MGGGGMGFLPWFGGDPLWDPSRRGVPRRRGLLLSSGRAELGAAGREVGLSLTPRDTAGSTAAGLDTASGC